MFDRSTSTLALTDPEIWAAVQAENRRQEEHIELIASENYTSPAVMAAQGSQLTNKYAEGYPGKRYYGGCEHVDVVEQLAIEAAGEGRRVHDLHRGRVGNRRQVHLHRYCRAERPAARRDRIERQPGHR